MWTVLFYCPNRQEDQWHGVALGSDVDPAELAQEHRVAHETSAFE
ncbi:MAG: hypothetical protein WKF72_04170 [Nocardioidaceae bacterium]